VCDWLTIERLFPSGFCVLPRPKERRRQADLGTALGDRSRADAQVIRYWLVVDVMRRLHLIGLPHTETTSAFYTCAYTQKACKSAKAFTQNGQEVILYSGEENTAPCAQHIQLVTRAEQEAWFGPHDENDLDRGGFDWNASSPWWRTWNARLIGAVAEHAQPEDLILLPTGTPLLPAITALERRGLRAVEYGVGYEGITHLPAAFESETFRHYCYAKAGINDGRLVDSVIPNLFDPDDFPLGTGGSYLLYVGRLIRRKGVQLAADIAAELAMPLLVAGPGAIGHGPGWVEASEGRFEGATLEYVGAVGFEERAKLMGGAACLLAPTLYLEPFGGVVIEANLCGTSAVTTPFGAFVETVPPSLRFHSVTDGCRAVETARSIGRRGTRAAAAALYGLDAVAERYEDWFARLAT
jgi:glycosyltransferase involved in cell wall biosynthesis